ncbi:MAG: trypsin-like peptidase domain-containing protein [Candidatus Pacebacteria bacterium]|nr:trypsin-like peptidase domain-containing protein [Candidatus Paceibacterota bacterium]
MDLYELPKFEWPKIKKSSFNFPKFWKNQIFWIVILTVLVSSIFGFTGGVLSGLKIKLPEIQKLIENNSTSTPQYVPQTSQEEAIISAVKTFSPAVVSIVITKEVPIIEQYYYNPFPEFGQEFQIPGYRQQGTEKQEVGGGTGFIVSEDGMILTNKHVVLDTEAEYSVLTNDGKNYPAEVLARDPVQDLAVIKINQEKSVNSQGNFSLTNFPVVKLGDSDALQIGQTVIAIGNALGEFRNTVSVGVVSGLGRSITASGGGLSETIEDVIQTDAAINQGNSGGPLLNLKGEVIGINTAIVQGAQNIGFAIPINKAKRDIEQIKATGKIVYPYLGVRYVLITEKIQQDNNLSVSYGAWVTKGENGEEAVASGSAAEKAGLKENDIILEFNGEKITTDNSLSKVIQKYDAGDKVVLKILRDKEEKLIQVTLGERTE